MVSAANGHSEIVRMLMQHDRPAATKLPSVPYAATNASHAQIDVTDESG